MQTQTINLYEFDELTPDVQKKVLNDHRDINVSFAQWCDYELGEIKKHLAIEGYENVDFMYSGFGSQGDGASFTASVDLERWISNNELERSKFRSILSFDPDCAKIKRTHYHHLHCHEFTIGADVSFQDAPNTILDLAQELESVLTFHARQLSKDAYKQLEELNNGLVSDDSVADSLRANAYTFEANGTMRNI